MQDAEVRGGGNGINAADFVVFDGEGGVPDVGQRGDVWLEIIALSAKRRHAAKEEDQTEDADEAGSISPQVDDGRAAAQRQVV